MTEEKEKKGQLNDRLEVDCLKIHVPYCCRLHFSDPPKENAEPDVWKQKWQDYFEELACLEKEKEGPHPDGCCNNGCPRLCKKDCHWILKGQCAIKHACRVHERIQRHLLRLPGVTATDVGFAILERKKEFENVLAIRIHVTKKLKRWQLLKAGIPELTDPCYAYPPKDEDDKCCKKNDRLRSKLCALLGVEAEYLKESMLKVDYQYYPIIDVDKIDLTYDSPPNSLLAENGCPNERLQVCGVSIDIVQAKYFPSVLNSESDSDGCVFVDPPRTSAELSEEEQLLTGRCRVNPLVGGISVGSVTGQAGTLGTIVWDRTDGTPCLLSNWHVLAGNASATVGQPCYQPALFDGGTEADTVAHLKRWHLGELGDAAIAELANVRQYASGEVMGLWHPLAGYQQPELNMEVLKWGRTTGFTQGFIDGIHLATSIDYGNGVVRYFKDQFHIAPLYSGHNVSQVGDSGSLVLTCRKLVALTQAEKDIENAPHLKIDGGLADDEQCGEEIENLKNLKKQLRDLGFPVDEMIATKKKQRRQEKPHAYLIVGMLFAGDTPGSPFGEFALASNVSLLAKELQFSLRPVFEPRSSFRRVRSLPPGSGPNQGTGTRGRIAPRAQAKDSRGQGPQPDYEPAQSGPGSSG